MTDAQRKAIHNALRILGWTKIQPIGRYYMIAGLTLAAISEDSYSADLDLIREAAFELEQKRFKA